MNGTVKFFDSMKGFGFITGEDGKEYFVHSTAIAPGVVIRDNDAVTFDVVQGDRGPKAANVKKGAAAAPAAPAEEEPSEEEPSEEESSEDEAEESDEDESSEEESEEESEKEEA